jgi:hypothetical protein
MDGELVHADTSPAMIAAVAIAHFGHLFLPSGTCRFKVVPEVGINVTPRSQADASCPVFGFLGNKTKHAIQRFSEETDGAFFKVIACGPITERAGVPIRHDNAETGIPHYMNM